MSYSRLLITITGLMWCDYWLPDTCSNRVPPMWCHLLVVMHWYKRRRVTCFFFFFCISEWISSKMFFIHKCFVLSDKKLLVQVPHDSACFSFFQEKFGEPAGQDSKELFGLISQFVYDFKTTKSEIVWGELTAATTSETWCGHSEAWSHEPNISGRGLRPQEEKNIINTGGKFLSSY